MRHYALLQDFFVQPRERVKRSSHFEGPDALVIFALEEQLDLWLGRFQTFILGTFECFNTLWS